MMLLDKTAVCQSTKRVSIPSEWILLGQGDSFQGGGSEHQFRHFASVGCRVTKEPGQESRPTAKVVNGEW